jgi:CcmD family protein
MTYLYAAYAATWIIHIAYLVTLLTRYSRLRDEIRDFKNTRER